MKTLMVVSILALAQVASADGGCTALVNHIGSYKQNAITCQNYFLGPSLTVKPYAEREYSGYWITSGATGFGPTTSDSIHDMDKCYIRDGALVVEISGNDTIGTQLPRKGRVSYEFTGDDVAFTADGCTARYSKN